MSGFVTLQEFYGCVRTLRKTVRKEELISGLCHGKEVLDIGCIDHSYRTALDLGDDWLHGKIKGVAEKVTGLDILAEDAAVLNGLGFDIIVADAENFDTGKKYDVINAGDIIEHLSNIGSFLDCVGRHLKDNGIAIITTPNPFNIEQFCSILFSDSVVVNDQHTVWMDPMVFWQMATRHGFEVTEFFWIETRFKILREPQRGRIIRHAVVPFAELLMKWRPLFRRDCCFVIKVSQQPTAVFGT